MSHTAHHPDRGEADKVPITRARCCYRRLRSQLPVKKSLLRRRGGLCLRRGHTPPRLGMATLCWPFCPPSSDDCKGQADARPKVYKFRNWNFVLCGTEKGKTKCYAVAKGGWQKLGKDITVTKLDGSFDRSQKTLLAKATYKVTVVEGSNRTVFHVRLTEATLELIADPKSSSRSGSQLRVSRRRELLWICP